MIAAALIAATGTAGATTAQPVRHNPPGEHETACLMKQARLASGDSAYTVLRGAGVTAGSVMRWLQTGDDARALRHLHVGDTLTFCVTHDLDGAQRLQSLALTHRDQTTALPGPPVLHHGIAQVAMTVRHSLLHALRAHHVRARLVDAVRLFLHHDRRLPAHLPKGTQVVAVFAGTDKDPQQRLLCVDVHLKGHHHRIFHFVDGAGHQYLMGEDGRGLRMLSLGRPLRHERISSGWGWRINPVLKRREFHKGIDFAAPLGTPIRAAMAGTVDLAAWHGNYGRLVEIRHVSGLATRYGHLHRFARGIHPGTHVHAGQVIGYVGTSGLSTGPHLYFELWEHHRRVDPLVGVPTVRVHLQHRERRQFETYVHRLDRRLSLG
jgi:murein DD-endopeptidase MepM/ murein hydrolase activator NlpD